MPGIDPKSLTIDFRALSKMTPSQRVKSARDDPSYLSSLTPSQLAALFPKYYRDQLPDMGIGVAASGGSKLSPSVAPSKSASVYTPSTPSFTPRGSAVPGNQAAPKTWAGQLAKDKPLSKEPAATAPTTATKLKGPSFKPDIDKTISDAAKKYGVDEGMLRTFAQIESSGNPRNVTGSYKGLFQLSESEFRKYGGQGDILDPTANANAAAQKLKAESEQFTKKNGRAPTATDIYMIHQQGPAGSAAHRNNPDGIAWQNIRKYYKSDRMAKKAIWGNVPDDMKRKYGSVENMRSSDFVGMWNDKINRIGGVVEEEPKITNQPQEQKTNQTGKIVPDGVLLGPKELDKKDAERISLEEANRNRPSYMSGKIRIGEGDEAVSFTAGSGGRQEQKASVPFGVYKLPDQGMEAPGPKLGGRFAQMRGPGNTKIINIPDRFDPKLNRTRGEIQIHPAIAPRTIDGVRQLVSSGCIAVAPEDYDAFMEKAQSYFDANKGNVYFVNVPKANGEHEWVITNKPPEGDVFSTQQALTNQRQTGTAIPVTALPEGISEGIKNEFAKMNPGDQSKLIESIKAYGDGAALKLNEHFEKFASQVQNSSELKQVAKTVIEAASTEKGMQSLMKSEVALGKGLQKIGLSVSEHPEFGGTGGMHKGAGHREGRALDVNISSGIVEANDPHSKAIFDKAQKWMEDKGYKVIWKSAGHHNHIHVEAPRGSEDRGEFSNQELQELTSQFTPEEAAYFKDKTGKDVTTMFDELVAEPTKIVNAPQEEQPNQTGKIVPSNVLLPEPVKRPPVAAEVQNKVENKTAAGSLNPPDKNVPPPTPEPTKPAAPQSWPAIAKPVQQAPVAPPAQKPAEKPVEVDPIVVDQTPKMASGGVVKATGEYAALVDQSGKKLGEVNKNENVNMKDNGRIEVTPDRRVNPSDFASRREQRQAEIEEKNTEREEVQNKAGMTSGPVQNQPQPQQRPLSSENYGDQRTTGSFVRAMAQAKGKKDSGVFPGSRFGEESISTID